MILNKKVLRLPVTMVVIEMTGMMACISCKNAVSDTGTSTANLGTATITANPALIALEAGGKITMSDITPVADSSYIQATSTTTGFVHNISAFDIGKYLVTYELWYTVYQWAISNGYTFANAGCEGSAGGIGTVPTAAKLEPVTTVNWRDCIVWCNAYSEMDGKTPVYYSDAAYATPIRNSADGYYWGSVNSTPGSFDNPYIKTSSKGYRLPTEGEYLYAASCKATYPSNYASGADATYDATMGGVDIDGDGDVQYSDSVAWYSVNSTGKTHDVGTKAANKWGLFDMSGNVSEWCQDWLGTHPTTLQTNYSGPASGLYRVRRGGYWNSTTSNLQMGYSDMSNPDIEGDYLGFRVCCAR